MIILSCVCLCSNKYSGRPQRHLPGERKIILTGNFYKSPKNTFSVELTKVGGEGGDMPWPNNFRLIKNNDDNEQKLKKEKNTRLFVKLEKEGINEIK